MATTENFNLKRLVPGDDFFADGYKFSNGDRVTIDRLLAQGIAHIHDGVATALSTPSSTLTLTKVNTIGSIPAGTRVYYRYSFVDATGAESAAKVEKFIDTTLPVVEPASPTLTLSTVGGTLLAGNYYYVLSAYTNVNTQETKTLTPAYITVPATTSTNRITINFPTKPVGATGFNIYRLKPGALAYAYLKSTTTETSFTDSGVVQENANRSLPVSNLTNGTNSVVVTIPTPVPVGMTWKLYRTFAVGDYTNSLLHWIVEETAEGSGVITPTFTDTGGSTATGTPQETSQTLLNPAKVNLTDAVHVQGRLPMGAVSGFPFSASFTYAGTLQVNTGKFIWSCDVPKATIISVRAILGVGSSPAATSVIVDINKHALSQATPTTATIFTTQANRPTILVGKLRSSLAIPNVKELLQGDGLTMDIDQAGGGSTPTDENLSVHVLMYAYGFGLISHVWAL